METSPPNKLQERELVQYISLKVNDKTMLSLFLKNKSVEVRGDNIGVRSSSTTKLGSVPSVSL